MAIASDASCKRLLTNLVFQMYQEQGTLLYMAMSSDASCKGLQSARDAPIKMEMIKRKYELSLVSSQYSE